MQLDKLKNRLARSKVLVITGAGLSTAAGIPDYISDGDYQGPSAIDVFKSLWNSQAFHSLVSHNLPVIKRLGVARATGAHKCIDAFVRRNTLRGYKSALWTQNVDGLHRVKRGLVYEAHGSLLRRRSITGKITGISRKQFASLASKIADADSSWRSAVEVLKFYNFGFPDVVLMGQSICVEEHEFCTAADTHDTLLLVGTCGRIGWVSDTVAEFLQRRKQVISVAYETYLPTVSVQCREDIQVAVPALLQNYS